MSEKVGSGANGWELEVQSRRVRTVAWSLAGVIVVLFGIFGGVLRVEETGVVFRVWDQFAVLGVGVLIAYAVSLFARPRLRAGAQGVAVRNLFGEKLVPWDLVKGLTFPEGAAWARLELPDEEYSSVLAIQIYDRMRAVDAVRDFRLIQEKYAPGSTSTADAAETEAAADDSQK